MHVLWTPSWYPMPNAPLNGTFFEEQVEILRSAGHDVGVYCLSPQSFWQWRRTPTVVDTDRHLLFDSFPTVPKGALPGDYALIRRYARAAAEQYVSRWGKPDVIHAHSVFPGVFVAQNLADLWGVPYGITEHRGSVLDAKETTPRFARITDAVRRADYRLAVSRGFANALGAKFGVPFDVAALPVPEHFFDHALHQPRTGTTRFVHVSGLDRWKRVEETIDALSEIRAEGLNVQLDIIGGTPERVEHFTTYVRDRGLSGSVAVLGPVSRDDLAGRLAEYDVLVLVSSTETAGMVFAEAQSLGIPVIGSSTFGGSFMVTPTTGIVVPIDEPEALKDAMRKFASGEVSLNPQSVRDEARSRFSADAFAALHNEIYTQAVKDHSASEGSSSPAN
ncbi:glycosyltransferase [Schaalia sp. ZJ1691]|uniref:glycosyltransferase n=1 Tax=Schaalia sp. ZJ1691 TaxID=2709404 RepID=UPI0013ED1BEE|nr:glycosyltransferase [Schaalia sp. ZJ1691]